MPHKQENPAGEGGALDCLAGRLDDPQYSRSTNEKQFQPGADECVYRLRRALRSNRLEGWGFNFTRSILRHSKRRDWEPSEKQMASMRGLVAELAEPNEPLIDDEAPDGWAA